MNIQNIPGKQVGPSRYMEIGLSVLVTALLAVSIIGIAYVYGFDWNGSLLDNISAAVRAVGVDGGFFMGIYFSRQHWTREKGGWWDGVKATLAGVPWFTVALFLATVSWLSNTLFVTHYQTIITQQLLDQAGLDALSPALVNKVIGGVPLLIVLLYSIVPRRIEVKADTRTPAEIEDEARREAARIRAQNMVAAVRAEGAGQGVRNVVGGFIGQAFNLEERQRQAALEAQQREERQERREKRDRMRGLANIHGLDPYADDLEAQLTALGVWNQKPIQVEEPAIVEATDTATRAAIRPTSGPLATYFTATEVARELGKPVRTISRWMSAGYDGPYHMRCRKIKSKGNARCTTAGEIARVKALLQGENPPMDTDEQDAQPSLAEMPVLVVSHGGRQEDGQGEGQEEGQPIGHQNGHSPRHEVSQE